MEIEIEHMDGAGIFIPGTFPCSCQIRGGWLKGAVFPFDFHKFIEKYRDKVSAANMIDAWGNPVTVEEFLNAKMILTDSQLKMRKYYDSMQEYRKCFKKAKLSITVNNCAHQAKSEVKVAYQPFQTIPRDNLTDETIKKLADKTVRYIEDAKKNPKAALQLMGIEIDSEDMEDKMKDVEMNVLHAAILKYPQLLNDIHVQKIMKSVLLSERRKAQGCKLVLDGFWSYICPDLYAFCQWLFLGQDVPEGLVPNGYIYNHYYNDKEIEETCCLRYPHLSDCEHGIRKVLQSKECEEWFNGTDTIVSSHDLISEVLQADWDGDHICLVHDKAFMDVLERDKYPLFYDMTKAESAQITNNAVMNCLINYRRVIVYEDGQYKLLRGSVDRWTGEVVYTLKKERYIKYTQTYDYKKVKVTGSSLVVGTFIVNYDMMNNTRIWHLNNDVTDGYYKHLYPVTEKQYEKLTELQEESAAPLSEEVIMDVINSVEYKQDGWNPYKYRRSMCGIGYHGCNDADSESISFKKWKNMMQRCYDKNVHKKYKPEYKDKTICEEWLNYANFRIWFDEHYVPGKWQIDLDKDLLVQGNKEYSPETCVFLEHYQNTMFEHNAKDMIYENEDGTFFIGKGRKKTYATYEEAVDIICGRNKKRIENEIEKSLGKIPMCAHEAMLKWDVRAAV